MEHLNTQDYMTSLEQHQSLFIQKIALEKEIRIAEALMEHHARIISKFIESKKAETDRAALDAQSA